MMQLEDILGIGTVTEQTMDACNGDPEHDVAITELILSSSGFPRSLESSEKSSITNR